MMSWQEAGTKTEEGVRKLQEGIDNLLAFMAENKTAADNPARWRQLDFAARYARKRNRRASQYSESRRATEHNSAASETLAEQLDNTPMASVPSFVATLTVQQQGTLFMDIASGSTPQRELAKTIIAAKSPVGRTSGGNSA